MAPSKRKLKPANPPVRLVQTQAERNYTTSEDPQAVRELVASWPVEWLKCRQRHDFQPSRVWRESAYRTVVEKCAGCTSTREWDIDPVSSEQFGPKRINYVEGFLAKGVGRIGTEGRDLIRLVYVKKTMPKPTKRPKSEGEAYVHKATREALGMTG